MSTATLSPSETVPLHAAGRPSEAQVVAWCEQFHRDGFLVLYDVLSPTLIANLKSDLDRELEKNPDTQSGIIELRPRMFENSKANVSLFELDPMLSIAEFIVSNDCHVIHNNSFRTPLQKGIVGWHQDDAPHYLVTHGEPPTNVRLPVLLFTCNFYLTDVTTVENGATEVIPKSHLFGKACPGDLTGTEYEKLRTPCLGKAGTVVMFNNQVWHRGGPNLSNRVRYVTQISYARRIIGHKYFPFMNYQMPAHVYEGASDRLKRLLGFLPSGAYG